jgi:hypothetical protein
VGGTLDGITHTPAALTIRRPVITTNFFLLPAQLSSPPDIDRCRPLCGCGAVPVFPRVGMHGDGLTHRMVPWPVVKADGAVFIDWVVAVGRRFRCPVCRATVRTSHPGLRRGALFGAATIAALLHLMAGAPIGAGWSHADIFDLVSQHQLPASERARSGSPRWWSLRRWVRSLSTIWPTFALPGGNTMTRVRALLASFGLGAPLSEVIDAAVRAHLRGGFAM